MRKKLAWFGKALISGMLAFSMLSVFCIFYYNVPVHASTSDGATDYSWQKNKFYSRGTEGFALGKTNNEGYLNSFDYQDGMNIDVLMMGSSHTEGYNVGMSESMSAQLGSMLPNDVVYNIGTSAHGLNTNASNLSNAIKKYKPTKYVVIEAPSIEFSEEALNLVLEDKNPELSSHSNGIVGFLQNIPFLRLMYAQLKAFLGNLKSNDNVTSSNIAENASYETYSLFLEKLNNIAKSEGVKLIIVYHPALSLNEDGSASTVADKEFCNSFNKNCEENGIIFLDMSSRFLNEYEQNAVLPHGYSNTSVGQGHLNKHGHKMIAEELYKLMEENK